MKIKRTHLTWSAENNEKCPSCRCLTVLVTPMASWNIHEDGYREQGGKAELPDYAEVGEEISGHWCPKCQRLTSLSLNT